MGKVARIQMMPKCDFDHDEPADAKYDGRTWLGPWAYMCDRHFEALGVGLGTGKGQYLMPETKEVAK